MRQYLPWPAVAPLLVVAALWPGGCSGPEWTTRSQAALDELRAGVENMERRYRGDAVDHFQRALELDPGFVAAKVHLWELGPPEEVRARLIAELRQVDLAALSPRERFMVSYSLAREAGRTEAAWEILKRFVEQYPEDLFGIRTRCRALWEEEIYDQAERCYQKGLTRHPNWVDAHNSLGYVAMAQGHFDQAEEHFRTYRFIAPDQANPHDSLGELLTTLGRYEEAEKSLHQAIRIREDFCPAWDHLAILYVFSGRREKAIKVLDHVEKMAACRALVDHGRVCENRTLALYLQGDLEGAWGQMEEGCLERSARGFSLIGHRLAVMTGRWEAAAAMEGALGRHLSTQVDPGDADHVERHRAELLHARAVRLLAAGDYAAAAERFAAADRLLQYWSYDRVSFKLFNRLNLLYSRRLEGKAEEAEEIRQQIAAVNPRFAEDARLPDLEALLAAGWR